MKLIEKKENQLVFSTEIEESLANAIRRYINKIPILAVANIEISKNDSPLYDETIAHRIGLLPLKMEKAMAEKTKVKFKLNTDKEGIVLSGELKGGKGVVYDNIPITMLNKGQELTLIADAEMGKGNEHAKFSAGLMFYRRALDFKEEDNSKEPAKSGELILTLESFGQLSVQDLFIKSVETLEKDLAFISKKLK